MKIGKDTGVLGKQMPLPISRGMSVELRRLEKPGTVVYAISLRLAFFLTALGFNFCASTNMLSCLA